MDDSPKNLFRLLGLAPSPDSSKTSPLDSLIAPFPNSPAVRPELKLPIKLPPPPPQAPAALQWYRMFVNFLLKRKPEVKPGRVLPGIDNLAVLEGRRVRAAFVYSDLHGFTKLVATQPENKSFVFLHAFIEITSRITKHYKGQVMDVAGDRVLSVFHRSANDHSPEPVEDAVTFALWLQTVFNKVVGPAFAGGGLGQLGLAIGVDYGEAVVGCVGIKNNKRIVFFGDPANNAAKLQEEAGPGETVLSPMANALRPAYLNGPTWTPVRQTLANGQTVLRISQQFVGEQPPKPR